MAPRGLDLDDLPGYRKGLEFTAEWKKERQQSEAAAARRAEEEKLEEERAAAAAAAAADKGEPKKKKARKGKTATGSKDSEDAADSSSMTEHQDKPYTLFHWAKEWQQDPSMPLHQDDVNEVEELLRKTERRAHAIRKRIESATEELRQIKTNATEIQRALTTHQNLRERQRAGLLSHYPARPSHKSLAK